MNQIVWTLLIIYSIVVFYIFFICMNIADYFDLKDILLPDNKLSIKIRKHVTLIVFMLITSSTFLYYYYQIEPTSFGKILVLSGFVFYCYIPYRFALDLILLREEAIIKGSDLDRHDQKQTMMHKRTHSLVEFNRNEIELVNELLFKKLRNSEISNKEVNKILKTIANNTEKINTSINSERNLLTQKIIQIQKDFKTLNNITSNTKHDLNSSLSSIKDYINNNSIHDKEYIQKLMDLEENYINQLSTTKELSSTLNRIVLMLTTKNEYLVKENKLSRIFRTRSEALKFIGDNNNFFSYDKENFIDFLTSNITSNAGIIYLKKNSRNNGLDKSYFLNMLLPQMFKINFDEITTNELQDFISSNFMGEEKEYISINETQITQTSLVIGSKTLNNFIRNNKGI